MNYKKYLLVAAALVVIGAASVKPAMAYFTYTQQATGKITVHLGDSTIVPDEDVEGMTKIITVSNTGDYDVFVRVKAIYSSNYTVTLTENAKNNGWTDGGDGYYYYNEIVTMKDTDNASSKALELTIDVKDPTLVGEDGFNIVIVQEATRVFYNEDGTTKSNWEDKIIVESDEAVDVTTESTDNQATGEEITPTESTETNSGEGEE